MPILSVEMSDETNKLEMLKAKPGQGEPGRGEPWRWQLEEAVCGRNDGCDWITVSRGGCWMDEDEGGGGVSVRPRSRLETGVGGERVCL